MTTNKEGVTTMANDISKLPKWAQDQINWRNNEIKRLKQEMQQLLGAEVTNITYREGIRNDIPLPADKTISFYPTVFDRERRIDVRIDQEGIYIMTQRRMIIQPEASNTARIFNSENY